MTSRPFQRVTQAGLIDGKSALIPLFKLLNPDGGVLRLGSDGADTYVWTADGPGHVTSQISKPDIQNLRAFAAATNYQVILGLNLGGLGSGGTGGVQYLRTSAGHGFWVDGRRHLQHRPVGGARRRRFD